MPSKPEIDWCAGPNERRVIDEVAPAGPCCPVYEHLISALACARYQGRHPNLCDRRLCKHFAASWYDDMVAARVKDMAAQSVA